MEKTRLDGRRSNKGLETSNIDIAQSNVLALHFQTSCQLKILSLVCEVDRSLHNYREPCLPANRFS